MGRVRTAIAATMVGAAIAAQSAVAQTTPEPPPTTTTAPSPAPPAQDVPEATGELGPQVTPEPKPKPKAKPKPPAGKDHPKPAKPRGEDNEKGAAEDGGSAVPPPATPLPTAGGPVAMPAYLVGAIGGLSLIPERQVLVCAADESSQGVIPEDYMKAFQDAAGRYELGESGVWALAAVARVESNFGKGMSTEDLASRGPLGITEDNWKNYAVDGDVDGKVKRERPADSAATLARMIWAAGDLRAGLFQHSHAEWYGETVLADAEAMAGSCKAKTVAYSVAIPGPTNAPINWSNVELSNSLEMVDIQSGAIDPRIINLIGAISQQHAIQISSLRSDHSKYTASGNLSNHYYGRAMDIAAIDGVPCTEVSFDGPCGTIARQLGALPPGQEPTELMYCFDPDGPVNPNGFAQADHCDHIHVGFDS